MDKDGRKTIELALMETQENQAQAELDQSLLEGLTLRENEALKLTGMIFDNIMEQSQEVSSS